MSEKQQRLVLAILDFLNHSISDGTVKDDDKESLEVAVQCIGEAFGVDPSNAEQVEKLSVKPATLQSIFDVYMKTRDKVGAQAQASASGSSSDHKPSAEDKAAADKLKQDGNGFMSSKKYDEAIKAYTEAINLDDSNTVFYSNRAAAYSSKGDHLAAIGDAEKAISIDPSFSKGYHRLGHAQYSLGDYKAAASAFERGLKVDPSNASFKSGLANAKARIPTSDDISPRETPSTDTGAGEGPAPGFGGMADMLRNMGGGGGGMPDIASLMNNPQLMQMAQQMAASGGFDRLMENPAVANMMERAQSGNMPSMQELMADPGLREMASQFGLGRGGGARGGTGQ